MKHIFLFFVFLSCVQICIGQVSSYAKHKMKNVKVENRMFFNILDTIIEYEIANFQYDFKDSLIFQIDLKKNNDGTQILISKIDNKTDVYAVPEKYFIYRSSIFFIYGEDKSLFRLKRFCNKKYILFTKQEILPYPSDVIDWIYLYDGKKFRLQLLNEYRK